MKVLLVVLGLSGGALLVASCGNTPATENPTGSGGGLFTECATDGDCPQPLDGRCGEGRCVSGKCEMDIQVGPIPSQIYGDCQQVVCDWDGNVVLQSDSSDTYDDGRECTTDLCEGGKPQNLPIHIGTPCPASDKGVCLEGECVECTWEMDSLCEGEKMACTYIWCVSVPVCAEKFCGGPCQPCATGYLCEVDGDCLDKKCVGGKCQAPTCDDGLYNGDEEDVDCGGPTCGPCADGQSCLWPSDCQSSVCVAGKCQAPTCFDGTKNGTETGPDCGGPCGPC